ncbi:MAG: cytochrome c-type biogenesis protein CcmH [Actinomycetota bacterium]|nr:cytochrome c-type biogenesis protein CcmH [Actinomycetota bacterium]
MDRAVAPGTRRRLAPVLTVVAAVVLAGVALGVGLSRGGSGPATLQERVQAIASGLRCPVCQNLSVADSPSPLAQQMRAEIAARLRAGQSPGQIRQFFVSRYGQFILLTPPGHGLGLLPWAAPAVGLVIGAVVVAFLVGRRPRGGDEASASNDADEPPLTEAERDRIRRDVEAVEYPD